MNMVGNVNDTSVVWTENNGHHQEMIDALMKVGTELGSSGNTALIWASISGDVETLDALIKTGADVNKAGSLGNTALIWAAMRGDIDILDTLIKAGADVNKSGYNGRTALQEAADGGFLECIDLLLSAGVDFI